MPTSRSTSQDRDQFGLKRPRTLKEIEARAAALAKHASTLPESAFASRDWLNEEPLTPAEVLTRFKIKYDKKNPSKKIYELTRRRGNRSPMPSHRVGKELRFYWSEIRRWQQELQQQRSAAA